MTTRSKIVGLNREITESDQETLLKMIKQRPMIMMMLRTKRRTA
jgi:hypothetical protein